MDGAEEGTLCSPVLSDSSQATHQSAAGAAYQSLAAKAAATHLLS